MKSLALVIPVTGILMVSLVFILGNFLPWGLGSLTFKPSQTVTVIGTSREQQENDEASFSVGVNEYNQSREEAVNLVNSAIDNITAQLREFGIPQEDIKTESLSMNRLDDPYRPEISGQWSASNTITVTVRDTSRVNELSALLASSGATNVYGPNFRVADETQSEEQLLESALEDAQEKARAIAKKSGGQLGKVLTVDESLSGGNPVYPLMQRASGMGGGGIEAGTTTVSKSVQVTFELK